MKTPATKLPSEFRLHADPGTADGDPFGIYEVSDGLFVVEDVEADAFCLAAPGTALWIAMMLNWAASQPNCPYIRNGWLPQMAEQINKSGGTAVPDVTSLPRDKFF